MNNESVPCANPKCRISFIPESPNQIYCSDTCMRAMANIFGARKYTTMSIEIDIKDTIRQLQVDVSKVLKRSVTYSELINSLISIVNSGDNMVSLIINDIRKVRKI